MEPFIIAWNKHEPEESAKVLIEQMAQKIIDETLAVLFPLDQLGLICSNCMMLDIAETVSINTAMHQWEKMNGDEEAFIAEALKQHEANLRGTINAYKAHKESQAPAAPFPSSAGSRTTH